MRCDKPWFCSTFCDGAGMQRDASEPIWDLIVKFNMYDPLALIAALPAHAGCFDFATLTVGGVDHRVVGVSKQQPGIRPDSGLVEYMHAAFLEGVRLGLTQAQQDMGDVASLAASSALRHELEPGAEEQRAWSRARRPSMLSGLARRQSSGLSTPPSLLVRRPQSLSMG